jgi:DNA topoisomerase VI subunit A
MNTNTNPTRTQRKGEGQRTNNSLKYHEKVKLTVWMSAPEQKELCTTSSFAKIAMEATSALGFAVTPYNVQSLRNILYPECQAKSKFTQVEIDKRVRDLELRIERIERELGMIII